MSNIKKIKNISPIPFHLHSLGKEEIQAINQVISQKWITTGPKNIELEAKLKEFLGSKQVFSLNSATIGLFLTLKWFGVGPGDEVITTPYSFVATSNIILECGAKPVFADIGEDFLINSQEIAPLINSKTKAVVTVDYGGNPCHYQKIQEILETHNAFKPNNPLQEILNRPLILADSAHLIGSLPKKPSLKNQADIHCYSFHAVKNITCGEGGAISIINPKLAKFGEKLKKMRLHGISSNVFERSQRKNFFYDMETFGYKANLSDIQASLLLAQLKKIDDFRNRKMKIVQKYDKAFSNHPKIKIRNPFPYEKDWNIHPHLYTILVEKLADKKQSSSKEAVLKKKSQFFNLALQKGVELNFHYLPIPLMSYYQKLGYDINDYPQTKKIYPSHVSLPLYPQLSDKQVNRIIEIILEIA